MVALTKEDERRLKQILACILVYRHPSTENEGWMWTAFEFSPKDECLVRRIYDSIPFIE